MNRNQAIALFIFGMVALPLLVWAATTQYIRGNLNVTGTGTFGGNVSLGGNTLTAGSIQCTTYTQTLGAAGRLVNAPGTIQTANVQSSTGTLTLQYTSDPTLTMYSTEISTSQPLGSWDFSGFTWGTGSRQTLARIQMGKNATTDNQQAGFIGFNTMRDSDNTLYEWARLHPTGQFALNGRAGTGNMSTPLVVGNSNSGNAVAASVAWNLVADVDPLAYQKCMIVFDGINDGGLGWGRGFLKILMNNASSNANATITNDTQWTMDNEGNITHEKNTTINGNTQLGDAVGDIAKSKAHNYGFPETILFAEESIGGASRALGLSGLTSHAAWKNTLGRTVYVTKFDTIAYESATFSAAPLLLRRQSASGFRTTLITHTYTSSGEQQSTEVAKNATYAIASGQSIVVELYDGGTGDSFDAVWARVVIQEDVP